MAHLQSFSLESILQELSGNTPDVLELTEQERFTPSGGGVEVERDGYNKATLEPKKDLLHQKEKELRLRGVDTRKPPTLEKEFCDIRLGTRTFTVIYESTEL